MHITCAICAELFGSADASKLSITPCGHIFHEVCLSKWFDRSKTCPECRRNATFSSIIRAYFNVSNTLDTSHVGYSADHQQKLDDLQYQLLEKNGALTRKSEEVSQLSGQIDKMKETQRKSRETIIGLERKAEQNMILCQTYCERIKCLEKQVIGIRKLEETVEDLQRQLLQCQNMNELLNCKTNMAEEYLNENMSQKSLAVAAMALKRELESTKLKLSKERSDKQYLHREVQYLEEELRKSKEQNSILESKVYKYESSEKENKNSTPITKCEKTLETKSNDNDVTKQSIPATSTVSDPLHNRPTKYIRLNSSAHSPFVKASSVAGLAPLAKGNSLALTGQLKKSGSALNKLTIFQKNRLQFPKPSGSFSREYH